MTDALYSVLDLALRSLSFGGGVTALLLLAIVLAALSRNHVMLTYYLDLAVRSFRNARGLTALMVVAIAIGIGASMTTLATFRALSGDPLPGRSERLMNVQIDTGEPGGGRTPDAEPDRQLTLFDARALLAGHRAVRQAMMSGGEVAIEPPVGGGAVAAPFTERSRYTSADFFPMFAVPFRWGAPWTAADDTAHAPLVVLSRAANRRLFGDIDSTGRTLRIDDATYRVVGVLDDWQPVPHFYDLMTGPYARVEGVFVPFTTAVDHKLGHDGGVRCFGSDTVNDFTAADAPCTWIQYWVELASPADRAGFLEYLNTYSAQQKAAGRPVLGPNARLRPVMDYLDARHVVPSDVRLQVGLAFGFLAVCLVNTVGLLLAKCLRRSPEIGVRRALGASRRAIFAQFLVESAVLGVAGGTLGLGLAWLGTWLVRQGPTSSAQWVHLDTATLAATFALALGASLVAGVLPAWRACQVAPAAQLKSA